MIMHGHIYLYTCMGTWDLIFVHKRPQNSDRIIEILIAQHDQTSLLVSSSDELFGFVSESQFVKLSQISDCYLFP